MMSQRGGLSGLKKTRFEKEDFDSLLERDYMLELEHIAGVKSWTKRHGIIIPYTFFGIRKLSSRLSYYISRWFSRTARNKRCWFFNMAHYTCEKNCWR